MNSRRPLWATAQAHSTCETPSFALPLGIIAQRGLSLRFRNNTAELLDIFLSRYHINQHFICAVRLL